MDSDQPPPSFTPSPKVERQLPKKPSEGKKGKKKSPTIRIELALGLEREERLKKRGWSGEGFGSPAAQIREAIENISDDTLIEVLRADLNRQMNALQRLLDLGRAQTR